MKPNLYHSSHWKEFRQTVIEIDGNQCTECGRSGSEVVLQVHHKRYISGRKPWEYGTEDCTTLCKYCHAAEHGKVIPLSGWTLWYQEDSGSLSSNCEFCGNDIRHLYGIQHENFGILEVGSECVKKLTGNKPYFFNRQKTFLESSQWKNFDGFLCRKFKKVEIKIIGFDDGFGIKCNSLTSNKRYNSVCDAKIKLFEVFEDGSLFESLKKKGAI